MNDLIVIITRICSIKPKKPPRAQLGLFSRVALISFALLIPELGNSEGIWVPLVNSAPDGISTMLLLSDGTVMAHAIGSTPRKTWYRLTPDIRGNYVTGTWSSLAFMHDTRAYYGSCVLRDGRVFVVGAEIGTGTNTAEVYNPLSNVWTLTPNSGQVFLDCCSKILPNGNVLVAPVIPSTTFGTVIYNPTSNTWIAGLPAFGSQFEMSWVKLPDESILTIDENAVTSTERYVPTLNKWIRDSNLPVPLKDREMGPALLLPTGKAIFFNGSGQTFLYTPTGTTNQGSWAAGPDIPNGLGSPDAPAAMMVNGKILCAFGPASSFNPPTSFYEYDPFTNAFTSVSGPTGNTFAAPAYFGRMLCLPDGTVLFSAFGTQLYVYRPDGSSLQSGKPRINSINKNSDGSYHLTGTLLNGISEGAAYGDDAQMDSNYPIVRITNRSGDVYYARTYNWNSTAVMTGNALLASEFALPDGLHFGTYSLVVVANGNASEPVSFAPSVSLGVTLLGNQAVISWPASIAGGVLQTATNLSSMLWQTVTNPVSIQGSSFLVTNQLSHGSAFFRLSTQ